MSYPFCYYVSSLLLHNKLFPKCTNLKQYMYIISHLSVGQGRSMASLCLLLSGSLVGCHKGVDWAVPSLQFKWEKVISNLRQLLSGPSSSQTVELKISAPHCCCLEAVLSSSSCWPLHHSSSPQPHVPAGTATRSVVSNVEVTVVCNISTEVASPPLCHGLWLGARH